MFQNIKNTLITATIGGLITIMWGGLDLPASNAAMPVRSAYIAPVPEAMWWTVTKWFVPVLVGVVALMGLAHAIRMIWPTKTSRREQEPDWFNRWIAMNQQPAAQKTVDDGPPAVHWLSMKEAINASTDRKWVVGQAIPQQPNRESSRQAIGQLLTVDYQTTQFAILGGSGGGKTSSSGMMMLLYAKMFGLHPIVLDGKDGLDWGPLGDSGVIEWHNMTDTNLKSFLEQLNAIYAERHATMRSARVSKIYDLPASKRPEPLFVIIEEFGRTWERVSHDKEIGMLFNDLFCLGRAAGIILCPIDQAPEEWTKAMRSNAKTALCYPSQGGALKAFDEHFISQLPQAGVFSRGNVFYRAWQVGKMRELHQLPRIQRRYLADGKTTVQSSERTNEPRTNVTNAGSFDFVLPVENDERTNERKTVSPVSLPPSLVRSFVRDNDWDKAAKQYFAIYPESEHIDWVKAMAMLADDGRPYTAFKGGLSLRLYNTYSPNSAQAKKLHMRLAS